MFSDTKITKSLTHHTITVRAINARYYAFIRWLTYQAGGKLLRNVTCYLKIFNSKLLLNKNYHGQHTWKSVTSSVLAICKIIYNLQYITVRCAAVCQLKNQCV